MKCVLIILNYNDSKRAIELARKSIKLSSLERVIIVDNKSTDNSLQYLKKIKDQNIDLVCAKENKGFASGNNIGAIYAIKKYSPEYILFANTDTIFDNKNIEACINALGRDNKLGLVSTRIKDINGNEERSAWQFKRFHKYVLFNIWIYKHLTYKKDRYTEFLGEINYVDIVRGSFMCFKAKALQEADFFDDNTFLYYEEEIISKRLAQIGYKVGILRDYYYIHDHINNSSENSLTIKKRMDKSLYYFLDKYYKINIIQKIIYKLVTEYSSVEQYIILKLKKIMH